MWSEAIKNFAIIFILSTGSVIYEALVNSLQYKKSSYIRVRWVKELWVSDGYEIENKFVRFPFIALLANSLTTFLTAVTITPSLSYIQIPPSGSANGCNL